MVSGFGAVDLINLWREPVFFASDATRAWHYLLGVAVRRNRLGFDGLKSFSASRDRERLGEPVTQWLRAEDIVVVDAVVTRSSAERVPRHAACLGASGPPEGRTNGKRVVRFCKTLAATDFFAGSTSAIRVATRIASAEARELELVRAVDVHTPINSGPVQSQSEIAETSEELRVAALRGLDALGADARSHWFTKMEARLLHGDASSATVANADGLGGRAFRSSRAMSGPRRPRPMLTQSFLLLTTFSPCASQ